jgi:DNA polymerase I-like protein with 3'-5' exonuclease and polymerase domains
LAEFVLNGQSIPYPSLDGTAAAYGLGQKLDVVKLDYWDKGIDTPEIPLDILLPYQKQDIQLTYQIYQKQLERFKKGNPRLYNAFVMQCKDILILEEAEYEGLMIDTALAAKRAEECITELDEINVELARLIGDAVNWNSPDQLSAVLYGGVVREKTRVATERVLKDGTIKHGEKWGEVEKHFKQLVKPPKNSEHAATKEMSDEQLMMHNQKQLEEGKRLLYRTYKTDEPTLKSLKGTKKVKKIVELLIRYSELDKLYSTYYKGLPDKIVEMDWPDGELHGNFNMCVVPTSRLSSSNPNLQNLAGETKELYISRYPC